MRHCIALVCGLLSLTLLAVPIVAADDKSVENATDSPEAVGEELDGAFSKEDALGKEEALGKEAAKPPSDLDRQLSDDLGEDLQLGPDGVGAEEEDPLTSIGRRMRSVEEQIAKRNAKEPTRKLQQQIVADLAKLIEQARCQKPQQGSSSSGSSGATRSKVNPPSSKLAGGDGANSTKPARDASERLRPDELKPVDMDEMGSLLKDLWGQLPERTREQMMQSSVEKFLPKYEVLIEKYFRRLAEEADETPKK